MLYCAGGMHDNFCDHPGFVLNTQQAGKISSKINQISKQIFPESNSLQ